MALRRESYLAESHWQPVQDRSVLTDYRNKVLAERGASAERN